jgi:omega-6 fatty acid desaturase (delta-12 desaturase)
MAPKEPKHLDLHGNEFELPTFTMKEIHDAIPPHCFKPSVLRSMAYVVRDYFYLSTLIYLAVTYIPLLPNVYLRFAAWVAYTTVQGFVFTGIWILAHECGHGGFSKHKKLNYTMGLIMHSFLLVPFHSWRISHSQHHKATGNIDKDTAFVPHTRESWVKTNCGQNAKTNMIEFAELAEDSPIVALWHDIVHQLFGWPGYLLCNLTGQKYQGQKGLKIMHFYFGEDSVFFKKSELPLIMLSDLGVAIMIAGLVVAGQIFGSWNVIVLWGVPWLWVNNWIGQSMPKTPCSMLTKQLPSLSFSTPTHRCHTTTTRRGHSLVVQLLPSIAISASSTRISSTTSSAHTSATTWCPRSPSTTLAKPRYISRK